MQFQKSGGGQDSQIASQKFGKQLKKDVVHVKELVHVHHNVQEAAWVHVDQKQAHDKHSGSGSHIWTHPLVLGTLLGFFLIGPDHLGTLMALSTLTSGFTSFQRGFCWGAGHSTGVMLLCPIFLTLEHLTSKTISRETWEHCGDIFIGISMILLSLYFLYYKDSYLEMRADGTYVAKGCACHGPSFVTMETPATAIPKSFDNDGICGECSPQKKALTPTNLKSSDLKDTDSEQETDDSASIWHVCLNSLLGLFQGLCCPLGVTAGGFMSRITATASTPMLLGFMVVFFLASGVGSGLIALGWGALSTKGSGGTCLARSSTQLHV
jgi:hypothetical protein